MNRIVGTLILLASQGCVQESSDDNLTTDDSEEPLVELVRSVSALNDVQRIAAVAEVDKTVEGNFDISWGLLRYEPVLIDPSAVIVGDLARPGAIAREFQISIFGDVSYTVSQTEFDPLNTNHFARMKGVLNGGGAGKIRMGIQSGLEWPPSLLIRIDAPPRFYLLLATDNIPYVYVAAEFDVE